MKGGSDVFNYGYPNGVAAPNSTSASSGLKSAAEVASVRPGEGFIGIPHGVIQRLEIYRKALEEIQDLPRRYGHFDGWMAASDAVKIAKDALKRSEPLLVGRSTSEGSEKPTEAKI